MARQHKIKCLLIIFLLISASLLMGCALGVTSVKVGHDPLNRIEDKKDGNILVNQFKDVRPRAKEYIGNKRNMYGMVLGHIGTEQGVSLTETLTTYFGEALREAGYTVVIAKGSNRAEDSEKIKFDAMIDGEINEFWLDLYMAVWHKAAVKLTVKNPNSREVLWEKVIRGEETNALWWGVTSEYEKVIRQALTKALNQAASEFVSEEFYKVVKLEKPLAVKEPSKGKEDLEVDRQRPTDDRIVGEMPKQEDHPCAEDIAKFCKDEKPGIRRGKCLRDHERELSPACKARIAEVRKERTEIILQACKEDVEKFCLERSRIIRCLQEYESELSPGCREKISQTIEK